MLEDCRITYDREHFLQRCRERDRSTGYILEKLRDADIEAVRENPRPSGTVQYDRTFLVEVPDGATYRYAVVVYLKGEREVYCKTLWRVTT